MAMSFLEIEQPRLPGFYFSVSSLMVTVYPYFWFWSVVSVVGQLRANVFDGLYKTL
jgi:hypothetical protein